MSTALYMRFIATASSDCVPADSLTIYGSNLSSFKAIAKGSNSGPYSQSLKVRCFISPFAPYIIFEKCTWKCFTLS